MKFSKKALQGALSQDNTRAYKKYALVLHKDAPVAIVDGRAYYSIDK